MQLIAIPITSAQNWMTLRISYVGPNVVYFKVSLSNYTQLMWNPYICPEGLISIQLLHTEVHVYV